MRLRHIKLRLRLRMADSRAIIFRSNQLIKTEFRLFYDSRFKVFKHLLTILKALTSLLWHSLRLLFLAALRMLSIRLCITYYILCLAFIANFPFPLVIPVLKIWYICMAYGLCVFLYFLSAGCDYDVRYHGSDRWLRAYWRFAYGDTYKRVTSSDRVTSFYKSVRYDRNAYFIFVVFAYLVYRIQFNGLIY